MKKTLLVILAAAMVFAGCKQKTATAQAQGQADPQDSQVATVYLTRDISPEALVKIYQALGVEAKGHVAVKISTGEGSNPNYLKPELIKDLVQLVDGTIVECNTAYTSGPLNKKDDRNTSANHWKVIERHGFTPLFRVDIMDEEGEVRIPVQDTTHIKYDIVGSHMENYDFMIALNHFKGHPMGGYGGALKNLSIGCASQNGKAYIHSAGRMEKLNMMKLWTRYVDDQVYISVMNNMSIDCDCVDHPEPVKLEDYGILASTDPVALDQACIDIINNQEVTATNDPTDLLNRIDKQHGIHTIEHAEAIGLGTRKYNLVSIDK